MTLHNILSKVIACGIVALGLTTPVVAQDAGRVVATCSSRAYTVGTNQPITLDPNGDMCVAATVVPLATQDVNIVEVGGNAVTTTVPVSGTVAATQSGGWTVGLTGAVPAGTNNIGDVDVASIAAGTNNIGDVDVASIAAGTNNIGDVDIASALPAGTNNIGDVDIASALPAGTNNIGDVDIASYASPYPSGATPITASSGAVANAAAVATLTSAVGRTAYITGFQCNPGAATGAATVAITVAGVITGTMTYHAIVSQGTTLASNYWSVTYGYPVPASGTNTNIVVTMGASGAGNTAASCSAQGFLL